MSDTFASTIQTYNQYASQFTQHFEKRLDTQELETFLANIQPGGDILDAGCGSARDAAYMISKGYKALGIDLSEGLLAEAKKVHPEVPTQQMSFLDITFPDNSFDGVWCKAALLHLERKDIPKVLASFYRILKPGGTLFIQTKKGEGEGTEPAPFDQNVTRLFTYFTLNELEICIKEAGFAVIKSYHFNGATRGSRNIDWVIVFAKR